MTSEFEELLMTTASAGDIDRIKTLLTASQEPLSEKTVQNVLTAAAKGSHLDVVNFLLKEYTSIPLNEEIVRAAINAGSIAVSQALFVRDPSAVNIYCEKRGSPLTVACMGRQRIEYLRFLLESGADPNQDPDATDYPLALVAALYTDTSAIDLLLQHGARLKHSGALAAAAYLGNEPMMHCLLGHGARLDTDHPDLPGRVEGMLLHSAVRSCYVGVVRILLQHVADLHATDKSGATAIEVARQMSLKGKDMSEMLKILGGELRR